MSTPYPHDAHLVLQNCLSKMTPDMRDAFIEVLQWMIELPTEQQATITPERLNSLVHENFRLRARDHSCLH